MANNKPIFCITHPRACSTAFERVFMTRDDLVCLHEPFGDAFYYGPERLSRRFENDEQTRQGSGFSETTYDTIFNRIEKEGSEDKRVFIKDMSYYLFPPDGKPPQIAPSLMSKKRGIGTESSEAQINGGAPNGTTNGTSNDKSKLPFPFGTQSEPGNPTIVPAELLKQFHFTFLIRDPHFSIPSYYRCCIPPLESITGFSEFFPNEAGYDEVRRIFDYLITSGRVGPNFAKRDTEVNGVNGTAETANGIPNDVCVIDADDLLDDPEGIISSYCKSIGLRYDPSMLKWDTEEHEQRARIAFEKWKGWHDDALDSKDLKPRTHKKAKKSEAQYDYEWTEKYGLKGANIIRHAVDQNMDTYRYLKQFALQV